MKKHILLASIMVVSNLMASSLDRTLFAGTKFAISSQLAYGAAQTWGIGLFGLAAVNGIADYAQKRWDKAELTSRLKLPTSNYTPTCATTVKSLGYAGVLYVTARKFANTESLLHAKIGSDHSLTPTVTAKLALTGSAGLGLLAATNYLTAKVEKRFGKKYGKTAAFAGKGLGYLATLYLFSVAFADIQAA